MIDIKLVRENPKVIKDNLKLRGATEDLEKVENIIKIDEKWRKLKQEADALRHERNKISQEINQMKKQKKDVKELIKKGISFSEISNGEINTTELVADLINQGSSIVDGIQKMYDKIIQVLNKYGMLFWRSNYNAIMGNNISNNKRGIYLSHTYYNNISNNDK